MYALSFFFQFVLHNSPTLSYTFHRTPYSTGANRADPNAEPHPFLVWGFPYGYYDDDDAVPVNDGVRRMRAKPGTKARNGANPKKGAWDNNFF
jgi:hypothetical protein